MTGRSLNRLRPVAKHIQVVLLGGRNGENKMKKTIILLMTILLLCTLALPALAASQEPIITQQPQNSVYQEYSTAEYSVTVFGENLRCTWYLEFEGKTYNISNTEGGAKPWEWYAGETYGAEVHKNGQTTTFTYFFGGIEAPLDGAILYPVIEDGHYDLTGDPVTIRVSKDVTAPPKISLAPSMEIYQGDPLDLYCNAISPTGSALSYLWYETSTGKLQDIMAINKGMETADTLSCDTSKVGTRYYVCMVTTAEGGCAYSSVIPVTVTKRLEVPVIQTTTLPVAKTGQEYSFQLKCSDPNATFGIYYDPGKANEFDSTGLTLKENGELKGKPEYLGMFYFTVVAVNDEGESYMRLCLTVEDGSEATLELVNTPKKLEYFLGETLDMTGLKVLIHENGKTIESLNGDKLIYSTEPLKTLGERKIKLTYKDAMEVFYVTVKEAPEQPDTVPIEPVTEVTEPTVEATEPTTETTEPTTETTEPTAGVTEPTEPVMATPDTPVAPEKTGGIPWWGILLIALGAAGMGVGITLVVMKKLFKGQ